MLVLALDTATPAVTAGVVEFPTTGEPRVLAQRVRCDARAHAELLTPLLRAALREAGAELSTVDAIVCGAGPGPFTGLRVGMVTAAALGDALRRPVHGVCSLDAIASAVSVSDGAVADGAVADGAVADGAVADGAVADGVSDGAAGPRSLLVATDARRSEVYWARYEDGRRTDGPHVHRPADVPVGGVTRAAGSAAHLLGLPVLGPLSPPPAGLVAVAASALRAGTTPAPLVPLYLRRPDAATPGSRKRGSR